MSAAHSEPGHSANLETTYQPLTTVSARWSTALPLLIALTGCSLDDIGHLQADDGSGGSSLLSGYAGRGGGGRGGVSNGGAGGADAAGNGGSSAGENTNAGAGGGSPNAGAGGGSSAGGTGAGGTTTADPGLGPWEFNSLAEAMQWPPAGLEVPPDAAVSWTSAGADEPLGSMVLSSSATALFQVAVPPEDADQAHRKVYFRARAATEGRTETIKPFVMSTGWKWSDGGEFTLATEWSTAMFDLDNPEYEGADYDARSLINIGLVLSCASTQPEPVTCAVWVDRAWLE
ncbi:MAG TPA: hypothetical protein VMG12_38210 [Polyangiaceae bacterium]|nr:hypothetical protein [Polyangiaceae bacterium]